MNQGMGRREVAWRDRNQADSGRTLAPVLAAATRLAMQVLPMFGLEMLHDLEQRLQRLKEHGIAQ
jgi:hypothetical protein